MNTPDFLLRFNVRWQPARHPHRESNYILRVRGKRQDKLRGTTKTTKGKQ